MYVKVILKFTDIRFLNLQLSDTDLVTVKCWLRRRREHQIPFHAYQLPSPKRNYNV